MHLIYFYDNTGVVTKIKYFIQDLYFNFILFKKNYICINYVYVFFLKGEV